MSQPLVNNKLLKIGGVALLCFSFLLMPLAVDGVMISRQVSQSSDDARENVFGGAMNLTSILTVNQFVFSAARFQNITIPMGEVILSAEVVFTANIADSKVIAWDITGEDIADAPTFTTTALDISSRTQTSASVSWSPVPFWVTVGDSGAAQTTPYLKSIIQEIGHQG